MRCVSSDGDAPSRARRLGALARSAIAIAVGVAALGGDGARAPADPSGPSIGAYRVHVPLEPAARVRLRAASWLGGTYTASTGETVRVLVSEDYPDTQAVGQRWADFLASLVHGSELALVTVYVLTPEEMLSFCGPYALGCYGGNELAFMGEVADGVTPEEVARHEYGHHIAANRLNPPWLAVAWGPKRWASAADVCARAQRAEVFPGDEDAHYVLNPGEGFAEVYRVLNELKTGAPSFAWPLVDASFAPGSAELHAAEQDVVAPWLGPVARSYRARFTQRGNKVWRISVSTPLDGSLAVSLKLPRGALHELDVLAPGGRILARGLWSGRAEKRATATVCGERTLVLRVTRKGPEGSFTVRVTQD
jgi:hypothetical protein